MKKLTFITSLLMLIGLSSAQAGNPYAPGVHHRQHLQGGRIFQGVRSGELTRHETRRLVRQQRGTQRMKRRLRADGDLSAADRAKLHARQDFNSATIYRLKHNERKRY